MDHNVFFAQQGLWRTEIIFSSSVISVLAYGSTCRFMGKTVRIWWRLPCMLKRNSTSLSLLKWCLLPGGTFGRLEMTGHSGTSGLPSEHGDMDPFMISLCFLIESSRSTRRHYLNGLISFLLEGSYFCYPMYICNL